MTNITKIRESFDQYIVRPVNFFGFGGFVFDREGETSVTLRNEITDHYVEDNTTIQDQIAVAAKTITLTNYVGELADLVEGSDTIDLQTVPQKLTVLNGILPELAAAEEQAQESIQAFLSDDFSVGDIALPSQESILDMYSFVKNYAPPIGKQESAYLYFKALRDQKILMSIQTPFEFMTNMVIESLSVSQSDGNRFVSEFTVTFKEIRFAKTEITTISEQGRRAQQGSVEADRGAIAGKNDNSVLKDLVGFLTGGGE